MGQVTEVIERRLPLVVRSNLLPNLLRIPSLGHSREKNLCSVRLPILHQDALE